MSLCAISVVEPEGDHTPGSGFRLCHEGQMTWGAPWLSPRFLDGMRDDSPSRAAKGPVCCTHSAPGPR